MFIFFGKRSLWFLVRIHASKISSFLYFVMQNFLLFDLWSVILVEFFYSILLLAKVRSSLYTICIYIRCISTLFCLCLIYSLILIYYKNIYICGIKNEDIYEVTMNSNVQEILEVQKLEFLYSFFL